jgi:hypothetical protein
MKSWRRNLTLSLVAGGLAIGGFAAAQGIAQARQNSVVVVRFMLGYFDGAGRFVPTAGRNATNVDRNAIAMFVFSGPVDMGPRMRATLPLTLSEQAELEALQAREQEFDPEALGYEYEPGVIPRKKSGDHAAFYVATGSISTNSVLIAAPQAGGTLTLAPGQYFHVLRGKGEARTVGNRLIFNPRYTVAGFNHPQEIDYNPQGMEGSTQYEVYLDGGPNAFNPFDTVRNLDGEMMSVPFQTSFTTTNRYVQDYTRPQVRETSPTDGTSNVASDADIELTFSEPMNPASFITPRFQGDDAWTVIARYTDNAINGNFKTRNLLVQVRVKPQTGGEVIQLRPLQGFGKGPSEIEVIVRNGVTDLSGNNITRQLQFTFKSIFNPSADQAGFVEELFNTVAKRDATFGVGTNPEKPAGDNVVATWNTTAGMLLGVVTDTPFVAASPAQGLGTGVNLFGVAGIQFQNLYTSTDMGSRARTITSFAWRATVFNGVTYPNCFIQMGHANDLIAAAGFPGSATTSTGPSPGYYRDAPVLVVPATTYATAGKISANYVLAPTFVKNFNFDGANPVILECGHGGNGATNDRWQVDANYPLQTCTYANFSTTPSTNGSQRWYFDTKFTYLTPGAEAQSLFYDLGRDDARLLPQQLVPSNQPSGTSVTFVWQGAKADPTTPTSPDMSSVTPWVADVRALSLYRHIRFRVTLVNNVTSKIAPTVDTITIPYTYK